MEERKIMKYIIDRFEEGNAVCEQEDRTMLLISRSLLPSDAKEGGCHSVYRRCLSGGQRGHSGTEKENRRKAQEIIRLNFIWRFISIAAYHICKYALPGVQ